MIRYLGPEGPGAAQAATDSLQTHHKAEPSVTDLVIEFPSVSWPPAPDPLSRMVDQQDSLSVTVTLPLGSVPGTPGW